MLTRSKIKGRYNNQSKVIMNQKVKFTIYVRTQDIGKDGESGFVRGAYRNFQCKGTLLTWGVDTDENMGSYTVGVIELESIDLDGQELAKPVTPGQMFLVHATDIVFLKNETVTNVPLELFEIEYLIATVKAANQIIDGVMGPGVQSLMQKLEDAYNKN